jgi:hypothetical protein
MPIAWQIRFTDGRTGYQILDDARVTLGIYDGNGTPITVPGSYSVTNANVSMPSWGSGFTDPPAPPAPVPQSVTPYQARVALLGAGLLDAVNAAVEQAGGATKIAWEYATGIERGSPFIAAMQGGLGLSSAQVDALFIAAAQVI